MRYVDIPTRADIERLGAVRAAACVSIDLPTTPLKQEAQADRIALKNLAGMLVPAPGAGVLGLRRSGVPGWRPRCHPALRVLDVTPARRK